MRDLELRLANELGLDYQFLPEASVDPALRPLGSVDKASAMPWITKWRVRAVQSIRVHVVDTVSDVVHTVYYVVGTVSDVVGTVSYVVDTVSYFGCCRWIMQRPTYQLICWATCSELSIAKSTTIASAWNTIWMMTETIAANPLVFFGSLLRVNLDSRARSHIMS